MRAVAKLPVPMQIHRELKSGIVEDNSARMLQRNRSLKVSCVSVVYGFDVVLILTSPSAVSFSNGTGRLGFI